MVEKTLLWLQAGSCGGCTMALLESGGDGLFAVLERAGYRLLWHPSLSLESGADALAVLAAVEAGDVPLDVLCVEGAILCGPDGSGRFNRLGGSGRSLMDWTRALAARAGTVVAVGSCAAYGGIPAGDGDPTDARGLAYTATRPGGALGAGFRARGGLPVISVAGCAPHPGWIVETLEAIAAGMVGPTDLDSFGRPRFFADHLAHHGCGRNEFYEFKASAEHLGERGCLMEHLGCKATQAVGDCNQRAWNGHGSCTGAGYPCVSCTAPGFERARGVMKTPKVAGIPVGLPLDMPKAWFVALAALSKSATPRRVRDNARADRPVEPPRGEGGR